MSAFGLHPTFTTAAEYRAWRITWIGIHRDLLTRIRAARAAGRPTATIDDMLVMAAKSRGLRQSARERMAKIDGMHRQMAAQVATFPLTIENCPAIDFHFNKISIEFGFMPPWVVKAKGKTFYVSNVDFDSIGTTRETPEHASTKGSIRFRRATLAIDAQGMAIIRRRAEDGRLAA